MFKDYGKYLNASLKVYLFVLVIIFIMKLVGLDYFRIDVNNRVIISISNFVEKNIITNNLVLFAPLILNQYVILTFTCNDNSAKMKKYNLILVPAFCLLQGKKIDWFNNYAFIAEEFYFLICCMIYCKRNKMPFKIKRFLFITLFMMIAQIISILTRTNYSLKYVDVMIPNLLLSLDYVIMIIIVYKINFMKVEVKQWEDGSQEQAFSSLLRQINLKKSLKKLQRNLHSFKNQPKVDRLTFIIYFILSAFWNIFTLVSVLLIGKLNDTFIECIFIVTSFWLSKREFGKAFHLSSMIQCFIVSNTTYYVLNRITTPLGISIIIPIMLGVGLSYVTSKLVKETYKPLYRGMPKDVFESTILKVTEKDSAKYEICHEFYINGKSDLSLSLKYNYSVAGIRKIKNRINDKIKRL